MHSELEDWKNGWFGIRLSASPNEIKHLIGQLQKLLDDPDQHFHIASDYKANSGLGDIEISINSDLKPDNFFVSGLVNKVYNPYYYVL